MGKTEKRRTSQNVGLAREAGIPAVEELGLGATTRSIRHPPPLKFPRARFANIHMLTMSMQASHCLSIILELDQYDCPSLSPYP